MRHVCLPLARYLMRVRADVVGEDGIVLEALAEHVEDMVRCEPETAGAQVGVQEEAVLRPFARLPIVGHRRNVRQFGEHRIEVADGLVCQPLALWAKGRLGADVYYGGTGLPILEVYLHRVVTDGDDEVGGSDDALNVSAPRATGDPQCTGV